MRRTDEVMRRLEDIRIDLKEDIQLVVSLLNRKVDAEVLHLQQIAQDDKTTQLNNRVTSIEDVIKEQIREERARSLERERVRQQDRKMIITALVWPLVLTLLQIYLSMRGS